jgi:riboflavin kinase/FMN adenylyltransferase
MKVLYSLDDIPPQLRGGALAIGNFDGVHLGHARLVERLIAMARRIGGPAVVFTFDPHPVSLLRPDAAPMPLLWTGRKIEILQELGVDAVVVYPTNREFLELDARPFFHHIVRERLDAKAMVEGPNFYFGHNRSGTIEVLHGFCDEAAMPFEVTPPVEIDGQAVSSSRVRKLLVEGRAAEAALMLGRPHRVRGIVSRGAGRGSKLGFPTANLEKIDTLIPPNGIYAGKAWVENGSGFLNMTSSPAAISLGTNPTFGEQTMKVEIFLLDFQGNLYDHPLQIDFITRLRDTVKFNSVQELLDQMTRDVAETRRIVG